MTTTPFLRSLQANLSHLDPLLPELPRRNLAANASQLPMTDEEPYYANQIKWQSIPGGHAGTAATLHTMARMARDASYNPDFQAFARQFHSTEDLDSWLRNHFTYRDETEEILRTPMYMLQDWGRISSDRVIGLEGDCDDISTFVAAITKVLGLPTRLIAIRHDPSNPDYEHVFTQAFDHGSWQTLDPTVDAGTEIHAVQDMVVSV
jgi:hypothetical protein